MNRPQKISVTITRDKSNDSAFTYGEPNEPAGAEIQISSYRLQVNTKMEEWEIRAAQTFISCLLQQKE